MSRLLVQQVPVPHIPRAFEFEGSRVIANRVLAKVQRTSGPELLRGRKAKAAHRSARSNTYQQRLAERKPNTSAAALQNAAQLSIPEARTRIAVHELCGIHRLTICDAYRLVGAVHIHCLSGSTSAIESRALPSWSEEKVRDVEHGLPCSCKQSAVKSGSVSGLLDSDLQ